MNLPTAPARPMRSRSTFLQRVSRSATRRWRMLKYKMLRPIGNLLAHKYNRGDLLFETGRPFDVGQWIFHDENWIRVQCRREHRALLTSGMPLNVTDNWQDPTSEVTASTTGDLNIDAQATCDKWIYLYLDPQRCLWDDYSWSFTACRHTCFRELQFGFRYQDFYNRYRYRFEADHIFFDKVVKGQFHNALNSAPFRMELGVSYDVRIDACRNHFRCYVNGVLMCKDYDFDDEFPSGSIALILWEDDGTTDIRVTIGPISVYRLER